VSEQDALAIFTLMVAGATDYFDGKIARAWNQTSTVGALLDPAADRIYILATLIVLYLRDAISLWVVFALLGRDAVLALVTLIMKMRNIELMEVTFLGKAATFNLLYAFPLLLLATHDGLFAAIAFVCGWAFASWGIALYFFTGLTYFQNGVKRIRVASNNS
jgi:cardiolipin synthase